MSKKKKKTVAELKPPQKAIAGPKPVSLFSFFENRRNQLIILSLVVILFYGNTLSNQYALDDGMVLRDNHIVQQGIKGISQILSHDSFYGSIGDTKNLTGGRYRPLPLISYAVELSLFGNNPFIFHLFNILFYLLTAVVLLLFLRKFIFREHPTAAFIATLLFIIHPVHTEVVANIKSRDEIFSLLYLLLTLYFLLEYILVSKRTLHFVLAMLFYFLALLSKENGLTFVGLLPLTIYFFTDKKIKEIVGLSMPFAAIAVFYFFIRILLIGLKNNQVSEVMDNPYLLASIPEKYATIFFVFLQYLRLLFWPHPLTYDYSYNQIAYRNFADTWVLISVALHLAMIVFAMLTLKKKNLFSWCIIFYLASILIVSNIAFNIGAPMAERFLYQASLAFVIFLVEAGRRIFVRFNVKTQPAFTVTAILLLAISLASGYVTVTRNQVWKSDETLFLHDIHTSSRSARANAYAGVSMIRLGDQLKDEKEKRSYMLQSLEYFRKAMAIKKDYITTFLDMGVAYSRLDSLDLAEAAWNEARKIDPDDNYFKTYDQYLAQSFYERGMKEGVEKNYEAAVIDLVKSVKYDPNNADEWYNLGGVYFTLQQFDKAKACWQKTLILNPKHQQASAGLNALPGKL